MDQLLQLSKSFLEWKCVLFWFQNLNLLEIGKSIGLKNLSKGWLAQAMLDFYSFYSGKQTTQNNWRYCYKLEQGFSVTCFFAVKYNTKGYDTGGAPWSGGLICHV